MKRDESKLKEQICEIGRRIYQKGFIASNDGNISAKIGENEFLITPTGVSKGFMKPDMIVKVDANGILIEGQSHPSTEIKLHLAAYKERRDINSVVHAHSPYATAFAVAGIALDKPLLPETIYTLGEVPISKYATPSSTELANSVSRLLKNHDALLMANHGVLTVGTDLENAYFKLETLEFYAKISYLTQMLGKQNELTKSETDKLIDLRKLSKFPDKNPGIQE
ncbi:MAG: class II aldolase/adducin family protein [Clostridia bacterium]|jgi:L-fuculose-phosphate aldolase